MRRMKHGQAKPKRSTSRAPVAPRPAFFEPLDVASVPPVVGLGADPAKSDRSTGDRAERARAAARQAADADADATELPDDVAAEPAMTTPWEADFFAGGEAAETPDAPYTPDADPAPWIDAPEPETADHVDGGDPVERDYITTQPAPRETEAQAATIPAAPQQAEPPLGPLDPGDPLPLERDTRTAAPFDALPRTRSTTVPPWERLRKVKPNQRRNMLDMKPLVSLYREDPVSRGFDLLRTRLMQTLRQNGWSRVGIAAPTAGCGATFTAVNLALSLSRVPASRTVLMDLNQRRPGVAPLLGLSATHQLHDFLGGEIGYDEYLVRMSDTLALGLNQGGYADPAELLHDPEAAAYLEEMQAVLTPDVTVFDLPPALEFDDLAAFLPKLDGVLLVSDGTRTTARHIAACERILDGQTEFLGVVLNRARKPGLFSRAG